MLFEKKSLILAGVFCAFRAQALPQGELPPLDQVPDFFNQTSLAGFKPICEKNPVLITERDHCLVALARVSLSKEGGMFHHGEPYDDFSFPEEGFVHDTCKLYPHMLDPGAEDEYSWFEFREAMKAIIYGCAKKDAEWKDVFLTGGQLIVGQNRGMIVDVRNLRLDAPAVA